MDKYTNDFGGIIEMLLFIDFDLDVM